MVKLKDELLNEATPAEQIISALNELERRTPSKEVLIETKVGHVVNRLRKHSNAEIKEKARIVLKKWKSFYREISTRQPLEVRADLKTERFRIKSRNLLGKALDVEVIFKNQDCQKSKLTYFMDRLLRNCVHLLY